MDRITLWQGDCLELMKNIESDSIDCVINDPPYKTTSRGNSGGTSGMLKDKDFIKGNGGFKHNNLNFEEVFNELYRIMKDKAHGYLFCNNKNLIMFHHLLENARFNIFKTLIWAKNTAITNMYYMDNHEYIIFFRKGESKKINDCGTKSVLPFSNPKPKIHPSQKPIKLLEVLITNSTKQGETVLDFTMGSGSTGVACLNTNRQFIGIELDKTYFDIAEKRIKDHTQQLKLF